MDTHPANRNKQSKSLDKNLNQERKSGKEARLKRVRRIVGRYLADFEHLTTSVQCVKRDDVASMLHLTRAFAHDAKADHVLQQLIYLGIIPRCKRVNGVQVFDRDALVASLKAWCTNVA